MGNSSAKESLPIVNVQVVSATAAVPAAGDKPKCKACCACPDTKKLRDQCIMENGEENCGSFIDAHKKCMKDMGFNV